MKIDERNMRIAEMAAQILCVGNPEYMDDNIEEAVDIAIKIYQTTEEKIDELDEEE